MLYSAEIIKEKEYLSERQYVLWFIGGSEKIAVKFDLFASFKNKIANYF